VEIPIKRADLESLRRELTSVERLLEGYQRENEKLVVKMEEARQKHLGEKKSLLSVQENLNKEVGEGKGW